MLTDALADACYCLVVSGAIAIAWHNQQARDRQQRIQSPQPASPHRLGDLSSPDPAPPEPMGAESTSVEPIRPELASFGPIRLELTPSTSLPSDPSRSEAVRPEPSHCRRHPQPHLQLSLASPALKPSSPAPQTSEAIACGLMRSRGGRPLTGAARQRRIQRLQQLGVLI